MPPYLGCRAWHKVFQAFYRVVGIEYGDFFGPNDAIDRVQLQDYKSEPFWIDHEEAEYSDYPVVGL